MTDAEPDDDQLRYELDLGALEAEALQEPFRFKYGKHVYTLPHGMDMRTAAMLRAERYYDALCTMLGPEQQELFFAESRPFSGPMLKEVLERWAEHSGIDLEKDSASSPSLNRKARRSRPTSSASIKPTSRTSRRAS